MIEPFTLATMAIRLSALSKSFAIPMVTGLELNPLANREQAVLNQDTIVERPLSFPMQNTMAHQNKYINAFPHIFSVKLQIDTIKHLL